MTGPGAESDRGAGRAAEIASALAAVRGRVRDACRAAGRDEAAVELLAVTKTFPATDAAHLVDLGCRSLGEAREQEATPKVAELAQLRPDAPVRWHVIGRLQRNKTRSVARWAHRVETVDSPRLLAALDRATGNAASAGERSTPLEVLVQVSLDGDPTRGGCPREDLPELVERAATAEHLRLRGLMAVAPQEADPDTAFATTAELAEAVRQQHPSADQLSTGMSHDLEAAVRHGSTCVRVGTALLGARPIIST
ncbi:YggS family pyridoxal phosphate-dependent enzyme [Rhodococcus sp. X156]|uniref:YggS family pyridoxal phosphate-dependent enzyme n=1 Tax=Rhodococcus sp. X156 TaxID=2499145 RepID=UPI000FD7A935|nr:YggS family pyridoxal phosphate-dependent enzyme [Rhodococcus sp. X156]